jgi:hypothetical protein
LSQGVLAAEETLDRLSRAEAKPSSRVHALVEQSNALQRGRAPPMEIAPTFYLGEQRVLVETAPYVDKPLSKLISGGVPNDVGGILQYYNWREDEGNDDFGTVIAVNAGLARKFKQQMIHAPPIQPYLGELIDNPDDMTRITDLLQPVPPVNAGPGGERIVGVRYQGVLPQNPALAPAPAPALQGADAQGLGELAAAARQGEIVQGQFQNAPPAADAAGRVEREQAVEEEARQADAEVEEAKQADAEAAEVGDLGDSSDEEDAARLVNGFGTPLNAARTIAVRGAEAAVATGKLASRAITSAGELAAAPYIGAVRMAGKAAGAAAGLVANAATAVGGIAQGPLLALRDMGMGALSGAASALRTGSRIDQALDGAEKVLAVGEDMSNLGGRTDRLLERIKTRIAAEDAKISDGDYNVLVASYNKLLEMSKRGSANADDFQYFRSQAKKLDDALTGMLAKKQAPQAPARQTPVPAPSPATGMVTLFKPGEAEALYSEMHKRASEALATGEVDDTLYYRLHSDVQDYGRKLKESRKPMTAADAARAKKLLDRMKGMADSVIDEINKRRGQPAQPLAPSPPAPAPVPSAPAPVAPAASPASGAAADMVTLFKPGEAEAMYKHLQEQINETLANIEISDDLFDKLKKNFDDYGQELKKSRGPMAPAEAARVRKMLTMMASNIYKRLIKLHNDAAASVEQSEAAADAKRMSDITDREAKAGRAAVFINLDAKDPRDAAMDGRAQPVDLSGVGSLANAAAGNVVFIDVNDGLKVIDLTGVESSNAGRSNAAASASAASRAPARPVAPALDAKRKKLQKLLREAAAFGAQRARASDGSLLGSSGRGPPEKPEKVKPPHMIKGSQEAKDYMAEIRKKKGQKRSLV